MKRIIGLFVLFSIGSLAATSAMATDWKKYKVTITNATSNHVITPPLIVIHNRHFKLFEVTGTASKGLAVQAETGNPSILAAEVKGANGVYQVIAASAPVIYGNQASFYFLVY